MKVNSINTAKKYNGTGKNSKLPFKSPLVKMATKMSSLRYPETREADAGAKLGGSVVTFINPLSPKDSSMSKFFAPMQTLEAVSSLSLTLGAYFVNSKIIDKASAKNLLGDFFNRKNGVAAAQRVRILKDRTMLGVLIGVIPISSAVVREVFPKLIKITQKSTSL